MEKNLFNYSLGKKQEELLAKYQIDLDRRYSNNIPPGWIPMLEQIFIKLIEAGWDRKVTQIKEKFGELRFYFSSNVEGLRKIVEDLDNSTKICYYCGKTATNDSDQGWISMCDACICQAVGFNPPIRIGDQLDNGPEDPEKYNEWLNTKSYCTVCVATVDSYLEYIKKGDILFIFCNDPSFVFDGTKRPPINPLTGKMFTGTEYFTEDDESLEKVFEENESLSSACSDFRDSIDQAIGSAIWQDVIELHNLIVKYHNVGPQPWNMTEFVWNTLVRAFEAYDSNQIDSFDNE